jgi:hypothetical protein
MLRPSLSIACIVLLAAGCGRDPSASAPVLSSAQRDQQAIAAATETERAYQVELAKGHLDPPGACQAGSVDFVRLVDVAGDGSQGYSLAITPDARGAVAIWQGLVRGAGGAYQAYGPKGMRLDVNGWRQIRQGLEETKDPYVEDSLAPRASSAFFVACLDGKRHSMRANMAPAQFDRVAVKMRRLAGNYYSPPAPSAD